MLLTSLDAIEEHMLKVHAKKNYLLPLHFRILPITASIINTRVTVLLLLPYQVIVAG